MEELKRFYKGYSDRVYRSIYLPLRNKENAEDFTQEPFYRVHRNLYTFNQQADIST